jgi:hypothetical protein
MCFSAGASFTAGAVISGVGIATLREVRDPSQKLFAAIPLLFGLQQIAEGCVWLALQNPEMVLLRKIFTLIFLLAAHVLWPVMIPLSLRVMEENPGRKKAIGIFLIAGIILSLYYAFFLVFFRVLPEIASCHIYYRTASPGSIMLPAFLLYLAVTIVPLMISSVRHMWIIGIIMFVGCVVSVIFYRLNVTSVWCFFAAVISMIIFLLVRRMNGSEPNPRESVTHQTNDFQLFFNKR